MNESNAFALCAGARHLVDKTYAGGSAPVERRIEIRYYEAHVVQARTAAGDEFSDWGVGRYGFEQLDQGVAGREPFDTRSVCVVEGDDRKPKDIAEKG